LRSRAIRGAGVTIASQGAAFAVQVIATLTLARLLTPNDFGVVTMVTTFSLLLMSFGLNGFTEAVMQREDINHYLASNIFWISVAAGVALAILFILAGPLIAKFYGNPNVVGVSIGMSATILFSSFSVMHLALLKRAMRFSEVSINEIVAKIVSVCVSILLALRGWGYWALVMGAIAMPLSMTIGAWLLCRWTPSFPRREGGTGSIIRYAVHIYGRFTVNYSGRNMDNLLVGWRFGSVSLGLYKKAYDLFLLPASQLLAPLTNVAVSALSRLNKDRYRYERYFLAALSAIAFVGMGLGADLTLVGNDIILFMLGPKWSDAGRIFTFFGPGVGIMLVYGTHGWIHLSIGTPARWFRWVAVEFSVTGLLFILGLHWGAAGIAAAWTASFWLLTIPAFWYAGRPINFRAEPVIGAVWKYVVASVLAGGLAALVIREFPVFPTLSGARGAASRIAANSLTFTVLYLGTVILLHAGLGPLKGFVALLKEMMPWPEPSSGTVDSPPSRISKKFAACRTGAPHGSQCKCIGFLSQ
jgi:PST family polysaccharide transporter